jgi:hypothetical protein
LAKEWEMVSRMQHHIVNALHRSRQTSVLNSSFSLYFRILSALSCSHSSCAMYASECHRRLSLGRENAICSCCHSFYLHAYACASVRSWHTHKNTRTFQTPIPRHTSHSLTHFFLFNGCASQVHSHRDTL